MIDFYLLCSLIFGVLNSTNGTLAFPPILNSFVSFSTFYIFIVFILFCFDLDVYTTKNSLLFNQSFIFLFFFFTVLTLIATSDFLRNRKINRFEYDTLFLFVILSAVCLCFADDFLLIYLAIELQSFGLYVFATFNRNSEFSTESGLKYFVFGAIISCFLLLGFAFIYLCFGTTSFENLINLSYATAEPFMFCGIIFILIAFLFKVGSAPFHTWLCDVYDGAILSVTMLFASIPKIVIFSVVIKLFILLFYDFQDVWAPFFLFASTLSITVGSLSAIYQKRLKRLFAYSTIAHTGFILLGIICATPDAVKSMTFYIIIYTSLTILLFSLLIFAAGNVKNFPKYLSNWTASGLKNYTFIMTFTLVMFSIAGVPPLAGFFSKLLILTSLVGENYIVTALYIVIISSIACFYYIRLIKTFFFVKTSKNNFWISSAKRQNTEITISLLLFFNLFFVTFPQVFGSFSTMVAVCLI